MQKMLKAVRRNADKALIGAAAVGTSVNASAADWSAMTTSLDFSGEETAVIAIVGVLFGFYVVRKGATLLLSMIR